MIKLLNFSIYINQLRKGPAYEKLALRNLISFLCVGPVKAILERETKLFHLSEQYRALGLRG